jgi:hypothetical protein
MRLQNKHTILLVCGLAALFAFTILVFSRESVDPTVLRGAGRAAVDNWDANTFSWDERTERLQINTTGKSAFDATVAHVCGDAAVRHQIALGATVRITWFRGLIDTEQGPKQDKVLKICGEP